VQTTLQEGCKPSKGSAQKERAAAMQPSLARTEATVLVFDDEEDALTTKYPSSKKEQTYKFVCTE